ncbi:MAG TPA: hypothetical protein VI776_12340 [Anaerolineales bacterium]|nr:hypothetical protein [Anaerolineales bacterium]
MSIALATAWRPRGELERFQRSIPALKEVYASITVSLPPGADPIIVQALEGFPGLRAAFTPDWSWGRHVSLTTALESGASHLQYADLDRLLRWVETRPDEWRRIAQEIQRHDCLVIGRTAAAYRTHPRALAETEAISNLVTSYLLGQPLDVSAGSKGFSRAAAEFLAANCRPGRALGSDAEWLVVLKRAGFAIDSLAVEGLDWESADRFQDRAAGPGEQQRAAGVYDMDPKNWQARVQVALEIVQAGLEAQQRSL